LHELLSLSRIRIAALYTGIPAESKNESMDLQEAKSILEGILFVADEAVTVTQLTETLQVKRSLVRKAVRALADEYRERGLRVQSEGERVQMVTAPETAEYVERFLGLEFSGKLSVPALETLAIVAYQQPITRPEIEVIRGVNCQGVLGNLVARGLIETLGRRETVGRPIMYGTTFEFLQYFGLGNLEELPELGEIEQADEG